MGAGARPCVTFTGRVNKMLKCFFFFSQLIEHGLVRAAGSEHPGPAMNEQMLSGNSSGIDFKGGPSRGKTPAFLARK